MREVAKERGVQVYAVQTVVDKLRKKGWIEPESGDGLIVSPPKANAEGGL